MHLSAEASEIDPKHTFPSVCADFLLASSLTRSIYRAIMIDVWRSRGASIRWAVISLQEFLLGSAQLFVIPKSM